LYRSEGCPSTLAGLPLSLYAGALSLGDLADTAPALGGLLLPAGLQSGELRGADL